MMSNRNIIYFTIFILLILIIAGCGKKPVKQDDSANGQNIKQIKIYQANKDATYLVPETHSVPVDEYSAQTALKLLISGTDNPEHIAIIPAGTEVIGVEVGDQIAYADFNEKIKSNNPGGSSYEMLMVAAIVNTLTEFPEIQQVVILINGKQVDSITGHVDTSRPLSRSEKIIAQ